MKASETRGYVAQDFAKAKLERERWLVEMAKPTNRVRWDHSKGNYTQEPRHDFFGCLDLMAFKPDRVRMIQVTQPGGVYARRIKILTNIPLRMLTAPLYTWEIWAWHGLENFEIELVKADGIGDE